MLHDCILSNSVSGEVLTHSFCMSCHVGLLPLCLSLTPCSLLISILSVCFVDGVVLSKAGQQGCYMVISAASFVTFTRMLLSSHQCCSTA
jgi:hypothetical protein